MFLRGEISLGEGAQRGSACAPGCLGVEAMSPRYRQHLARDEMASRVGERSRSRDVRGKGPDLGLGNANKACLFPKGVFAQVSLVPH